MENILTLMNHIGVLLILFFLWTTIWLLTHSKRLIDKQDVFFATLTTFVSFELIYWTLVIFF